MWSRFKQFRLCILCDSFAMIDIIWWAFMYRYSAPSLWLIRSWQITRVWSGRTITWHWRSQWLLHQIEHCGHWFQRSKENFLTIFSLGTHEISLTNIGYCNSKKCHFWRLVISLKVVKVNWFPIPYILANLITNSIHAWLTKDYR